MRKNVISMLVNNAISAKGINEILKLQVYPGNSWKLPTYILRKFANSVAGTQVMKRTLVARETYEKLVVGRGGHYELASGFGAQGAMLHVCVVNITPKKNTYLTATSSNRVLYKIFRYFHKTQGVGLIPPPHKTIQGFCVKQNDANISCSRTQFLLGGWNSKNNHPSASPKKKWWKNTNPPAVG